MDNRRIMHSIYFLLLLLLAALPGEPASAQSNGRESAEPETVIISGVATPRDHYTYRLEPFSVPAHTGRIEVDFEYTGRGDFARSEEHTSELQSRGHLVCRLLLEKKKIKTDTHTSTLY